MHQVWHSGLTGTISFDADGNLANPVFMIFEVKDQKSAPLKVIGRKNEVRNSDAPTDTVT